jgi:hypothetical protein
VALHNGLLFGKEEGLFVEWSFYQQYFHQGKVESKEQIKLGLLTGLDGLDRPAPLWAERSLPTVHPSLGVEAPYNFQLGLFVQFPRVKWLPEDLWLSCSLPQHEDEMEGQPVYLRSRFIGTKTSIPSGLVRELSFSLGGAYRSLLADISAPSGHQSLKVEVPVLSAGWRYDLPSVSLRFLEVLLPLPQLYRRTVGDTGSPANRHLRTRFSEIPTVFLLQVELGK